jgi:tetratricopeptide (TPR) repeat protein
LNNLANVYLELHLELPEAERMAGIAVDRYDATRRHARAEMERETQAALRAVRQREFLRCERDLAHALGTLGQARAANNHHALAIASWKASYDFLPLVEFDFRAKRLYEIALSCRKLSMADEARRHLERALQEARDPSLRTTIEAALK